MRILRRRKMRSPPRCAIDSPKTSLKIFIVYKLGQRTKESPNCPLQSALFIFTCSEMIITANKPPAPLEKTSSPVSCWPIGDRASGNNWKKREPPRTRSLIILAIWDFGKKSEDNCRVNWNRTPHWLHMFGVNWIETNSPSVIDSPFRDKRETQIILNITSLSQTHCG